MSTTAESAAYARRGYKGGAAASTLNGAINNSATTITVADISTWSGVTTNGPGTATINRGQADEETVEFTGVSGTTSLTGVTRGVGGSTAQSHASGATIEHTAQLRDYNEANYWINQLSGATTTAGDLIYATAANTITRLAAGTARQGLIMNAGATAPSWASSLQSLMTTTGDVVYASSANTPARLGIGTAYFNLAANSGATAPAYQASLQSLMTTQGDIVQASAANTPARLALGTAYQVPGVNAGATALAYQASPQSVMTTKGDLLGASAANTIGRLGVGTDTQVLTADAASTLGFKWATASGGAALVPVTADVATSQTTTSTTYADLATVHSLSVTVGASGNLLVYVDADRYNDTQARGAYISFALSGANTRAALDADKASVNNPNLAGAVNLIVRGGTWTYMTGLTPGATTVTAKHKVDAGTGTFDSRRLIAIPL